MLTELQPAPVTTAPSRIGYIRQEFPSFDLPLDPGERYERLVPDTLELQERAALAVHGMTAPTDPAADYEIYWLLFPRARPPMMQHDWCDSCQAKFIEALPLMRLVSGSHLNQHVERRWLETLFQMQGGDGLFYYPKTGRPWWRINHFGPPTSGDHYFTLYFAGRLLSALTVYHSLSRHPVWQEAGRRYVDGLARLAIHKNDCAFFEWPQFGPGGSLPADFDPRFPPAYSMAFWTSSSIRALAQFHQATGYEPALVLARKLVRWIIDCSNYFGGDGAFVHEPAPPDTRIAAVAGAGNEASSYAHFHGHTVTLLALLEFGVLAQDRDVLDFVLHGYRYGRSQGDPLTGFFPEVTGRASFEDCETCCVADMISLALKLSVTGVADFWDDADRWLRNQFVENQLTETDWTWRFWETGSAHPREFDLGAPAAVNPASQTNDRTVARHLGGFAAHASANDFSTGRTGVAACCTGNGARTLYHAWEHILHFAGGKLRIDLLLNRGSPWADVDSFIPYEGRVDVRVKRICELTVRLPEWVTPDQAACRVSGKERALGWDGRYALIGTVEPGQVAALTFPIAERMDRVYIQKYRFTLLRKGNEVVRIDPPGQYLPLYQRDHYRRSEVRWRKMERFVAENPIAW